MKINAEHAVKSVINTKQQRSKQLSIEQKHMFARLKDRKRIDEKVIEKIAKTDGVKLTSKTLQDLKAKSEAIFKKSLNEFRKIKRPAPHKKRGGILPVHANPHHIPGGNGEGAMPAPQPEPEVLQAICFNSAIRCEGKSCDRNTSTIFPEFESSGEGGPIGIGPSAITGQSNSLFFLYVPKARGMVNILAEVFLTGDVVANSEPLYLLDFLLPGSSTRAKSSAEAKLKLELIIWQINTIVNKTEMTVAELYSDDGSDNSLAFRDDLFMLNTTIAVEKEIWIVIEIKATGVVRGRSHFAKALIDFSKGKKANGFNFGIRVPQLCVLPLAEIVVNPL